MKEETKQETKRGNTILDEQRKMNFNFIFGCRPSAGVKGNTDMVQNILLALIQNADRVNAKVLIPSLWSISEAAMPSLKQSPPREFRQLCSFIETI